MTERRPSAELLSALGGEPNVTPREARPDRGRVENELFL